MLKLGELVTPENALPYGWIGVIAAFQFGIWYYLGIEGTTQAAEEVRSPARSLPYGTMAGMITLLIAAALTWYVCASLLPWEYLGFTFFPLYDAARVTGSGTLEFLLFWGTVLSAVASANGCINDAARAWFSLGRDRYLPTWFSAVHPKYRTPYRSILFLLPIALAFAFIADLNQAITFSILSGVLQYTFMSINIVMFRNKWPLGTHPARLYASVPSDPGLRAVRAVRGHLLRDLPRLRLAADRHGRLLHPGLAVVPFLPLQVRAPRRPVHHAVAQAAGLLNGAEPCPPEQGGPSHDEVSEVTSALLAGAVALALSCTSHGWRAAAATRRCARKPPMRQVSRAVIDDAVEISNGTAGVFTWAGSWKGQRVQVRTIVDTLATRKLPARWLSVSITEPVAVPASST